jgi:hypothetical protein
MSASRCLQPQEQDKERQDSQAEGDIAVPVIVVLLENICHALQADTRLHKEVEAHGILAAAVVSAEHERDELRREAVAEGHERIAEFVEGDVAAAIDIEAVEECAPCCQKAPEPAVAEREVVSAEARRRAIAKRSRAKHSGAGPRKAKQSAEPSNAFRTVSQASSRNSDGSEGSEYSPELIKVDRPAPVGIKHTNHHAHRMLVKRAPVASD